MRDAACVVGVVLVVLALVAPPAQPPTAAPPTAAPPTAVRPTAVRPTAVRPTLPPRWRAPTPQASPDHGDAARELGLRSKGSGYVRIRDEGDRFDALIRADGQVVFTLDRTVTGTLDGICAFAICVGTRERETSRRGGKAARGIATVAALLSEAGFTGTTRVGPYGYGTPAGGPLQGMPGMPGSIRSWGNGSDDPPPRPGVAAVGRYGALPAPVAEMSTFMDDTFEFRLALARAEAERKLDDAGARLGRELAAIWSSDQSMSRKRAAVLEQWAQIDAPPPPDRDAVLTRAVDASLDDVRAKAVQRARSRIISSVGRHAAAGTPSAFTDAELAEFNARDGVEPFCPYGTQACPAVPRPQPGP